MQERKPVVRGIDKIYMNLKENTCVFYFIDGGTFRLNSSPEISIVRFYEWFVSDTYYRLLTDEQFAASQEDTQVIDIDELEKAA